MSIIDYMSCNMIVADSQVLEHNDPDKRHNRLWKFRRTP